MAEHGALASVGRGLGAVAVKQEPADVGASSAPWSSTSGAPWPAGMKVLVVDDDPLCLKVVSLMLQKCDYKGELSDTSPSIHYPWCDYFVLAVLPILINKC